MSDAAGEGRTETGPLKLAAMSDAEGAKTLYGALAALRGGDVAIDGSEVGFLSALAAQTLAAAREAWRDDGRGFAIEAPSGALAGDLELLGLAALLEPLAPAGEARS